MPLSALPIQTDRFLEKVLGVSNILRCLRLHDCPHDSLSARLNDRPIRRRKDAIEMAREVADPADQWQRQVRNIEAELDLLNGLPVDADLNVVRFLVAPNSQAVRPRRLLWEEPAEFREQHLRISRRETKNGLIELRAAHPHCGDPCNVRRRSRNEFDDELPHCHRQNIALSWATATG